MTEDRTVHGVSDDGWEIVRYERAGKWYAEWLGRPRRQLTVTQAARCLAVSTARWLPGRPGGSALDRKIRKLQGSGG